MPNIDLSILNQRQTPAFYASSLATRPAFGFAGRIFIDTDSPSTGLYRDTGAAWVQIADPGAGTTGTLQQVTTNGNSTSVGLVVTAGTFSTVPDLTYNTGNGVDWLIKNIPNGPIVRLKAHGTQSGYANRRGALGWKDNNGVDNDVLAWDNTTLTFYTPTYYPITQGSVLFAGASGLLDQDNANFFWDKTNGHLGVNTNVPGTALDVHHDQPTVAILNQTVATNDTRIGFQNNGVGLWRIGAFYNAGANDFGIYDAVAAIQPVTVKKTTGQVLIGTSTVGSGKLVVASATGDNGIQIVGASAPSLRIDNAESGPTKRAGLGISTATNNFIQGSADRDFCMFNGSTTASPILFGIYGTTNVQEAARISAARNFLIGTTTDAGQKLQVSGTSLITGVASFSSAVRPSSNFGSDLGTSAFKWSEIWGYSLNLTGSSSTARITIQRHTAGAESDIDFLNEVGVGPRARIRFGGTNEELGFWIGPTIGEVMRLTQSQNVLIGTQTDAGQKLQVNGSARIEGLITQGGGIYAVTNQFSLGGGATGTFYTFSNSNTNQVYLVSIRQAGGGANNVVGMVFIYGSAATGYNIAQDNTNPALYLTISMSGLNLQLTTGAGYGTTTWDYTITIIK